MARTRTSTGASRQCFWRSADTASRRARVFWVNRSISGDLLADLPSSPRTSRNGFEVGEQFVEEGEQFRVSMVDFADCLVHSPLVCLPP
jgi:hypothetical protein